MIASGCGAWVAEEVQGPAPVNDMALLMNAVRRDFPEHSDLFRIPFFPFNGVIYRRSDGDIMYPGLRYRGIQNVVIEADKTGYIRASHYNIVASASHAGQRIVVVVMGAPSAAVRRAAFARLIESGFAALGV